MTMSLPRRAAASITALGVAVAVAATPASADPGDPVTGGSSTISVSASSVFAAAKTGFVAYPTKPATVTYAEDTKTVDYVLPVTGGDGSGQVGYGSIKHGGSLVVTNFAKGKSTKLTSITFSLETFALSATPAGSTTAVDIAELTGSNTFTFGPGAGQQTLNGTKLSLTQAGAGYLDKALGTTVFKAGQTVGSFTTTFTNTQY